MVRPMSKPEPPACGSIWRHHKGAVYVVLGHAWHSETVEEMVVYIKPYADEVWVRPLSMWREIVETPNGPRPRFEEVETNG